MRLVSLLPSATEIVYALGLGDTSGMTPAEIDSYIRDQLANGKDLDTRSGDRGRRRAGQ